MDSSSSRVLAAVILALIVAAPTSAQGAPSDSVSTRQARFVNEDVVLRGTLVVPSGGVDVPGVVILHGAGAEPRAPYRSDAEMLARAGIAALIYDKRGTGASDGDWRTADVNALMDDGRAAVQWLRRQPEVAADRVGVLGVSQGGWLAPFMAARTDAVAFVVQVTAAATPLARQELWATARELERRGFSDAAVATTIKAYRLLYSSRAWIRTGLLPLGGLWFVHLDPFLDPADAWPHVDVPALVIFGANDETVPTYESAAIVAKAFAVDAHPASRIRVLEGEGHGLGGPRRAQKPAYVDLVTGWIGDVAAGRPVDGPASLEGPTRPLDLASRGRATRPFPWFSVAAVQVPLMLAFVSVFAVAFVASLIPGIRFGGAYRRAAIGAASIVDLTVLGLLLATLATLLNADASGATASIPLRYALWLGAWASVVVAAASAIVSVGVPSGGASRSARIVSTLTALFALGFVAFAGYWGVLAGPV